MKFIIFVIVCLVKFCESNDLKCGRSDNLVESVEFYCESYDEVLPENCTTTFLQWIGTCDKSKVTQLKIGGCDPDKVVQLVGDFMNIRSLDISHSGYESLDAFDLKHQQLIKMNASHNQLTKIPIKFFSNILNVVEVDFSFNDIEFYDFIELPTNLKTVHLSHNNITSPEFCRKLYKLEYLDLSDNLVQVLRNHSFSSKYLKTLRLENNRIYEFDCTVLTWISQGVSVHISWENVKYFTFECIDEQFSVVVGNQREGVFHKPDGIIEMQCKEMNFKSINSFRVHEDHLESIVDVLRCLMPKLQDLDLADNKLEHLDFNLFQRFYNLEDLNSNNTHLPHFDFNWLKNLTKLRSLDISNNNLRKVKNISILEIFRNLYELNVEGNHIENTMELIQHLNSSIRYLHLSGNDLGKVNDTMFERLRNLEYLYLNNTNFSFGNASSFDSMERLQGLYLGYNNLEMIDLNLLPGEQLLELDLGGNNLRNLENLTRSQFPKLKHLVISENCFAYDYLRTFVSKIKEEFPGISLGDPWKQKQP
ncbi:chaoptin-like [Contarinia nasturtii]|uniref:chaoptin-like n=1 Tax=Contarinia nasturtii TaxID=265458 RepID=UPI0012D3E2A7|nr:chaoptin-like [Contarinia nasturtii]